MNLGNIERMSREFVANSHEFLYGDNFPVKKGTRYIIFYTKAKIEKFITRKWEEIFIKNPDKHYTLFGKYTQIKKISRETYLKPFTITLTDDMRKLDTIFRYFAESVYEEGILEISKADFGSDTPLYNKTFIEWVMNGSKENVKMKNEKELERTDKELKGMKYFLDPLEFYEGEELTNLEKMQEKLSRLKQY